MFQDLIPAVGRLCHGFEIESATPIAELRGVAVQAVHAATGAKVFHFVADDSENLFSVTFPTPPPDNTGLPHIMEHAALAGSRKFPVREPFFEMLKMSMSTFLNAMTGPDLTYYPVASNVRRDLFNLADVYLDAVFHPLLSEAVFKREGHCLGPARFEEPLGALQVNGIVFNEMKGAYSSPETRLAFTWLRALLPNTIYARHAAGDPDAIPELDYDGFAAFHKRYYHPSNAWFFFYGNIPTADYLAFLAPRLDEFDRSTPVSLLHQTIPERWTEPRTAENVYPAVAPLSDKTYMALHWWLGAELQPELTMLRNILALVLAGHEAAPLRKALIDSKLGQDVMQTGVLDVGAHMVFSAGLKGSEAERAQAFEKLVLDTLENVAERGLEKEQVESAFQQAAYHYLEIAAMYPLLMMDRVLSVWPYGGDPVDYLNMGRHLAAARARWEKEPLLFSKMIQDELLSNTHRLRTVLRPDPEWAAKNEAAWSERLRVERARLDDAAMQFLADEAVELQRQAGEPNSPESIALLPRLSTRDLPDKPQRLPTTCFEAAGATVLRTDVFSNGINYLNLYVDLSALPEEDWQWFSFYVSVFSGLGAAGASYEEVARRKAAYTGGLAGTLTILEALAPGARPMRGLLIACKTLDDQAASCFDLVRDVLFHVEPQDPDRLRLLLAKARAKGRSSLLNNSLAFALLQACRGMSATSRLSHRCMGLPFVDFTAKLYDAFDQESEELIRRLVMARDYIRQHAGLTVSFTGTDKGWNAFDAALHEWASAGLIQAGPRGGSEGIAIIKPDQLVRREALALPVQVACCAHSVPAPVYHDPRAASFGVGCYLASFDYMLSEIRLKGNAYGASAKYIPDEGILQLYSFRDPGIARTLSVFKGLPDFMRNANRTQSEVDRAIIGIAKNEERPIRPEAATTRALTQHLTDRTEEQRAAFYSALLAATPASIADAVECLDAAAMNSGSVCVAANRESIDAANRELGDDALTIVEPAMPI